MRQEDLIDEVLSSVRGAEISGVEILDDGLCLSLSNGKSFVVFVDEDDEISICFGVAKTSNNLIN